MNKKIYIVTGAAGHLGNTIVRQLSLQNGEVRGLVLDSDDLTLLEGFNVKLYKGNICDKKSLDEIFKHDESDEVYVIHSAGLISIQNKISKKVYDVNVNGTKNIVDKCIEENVRRLVYVSSVHAIKEEDDVIKETLDFSDKYVVGGYAKSKALATQYVLSKSNELDLVVVHPSGIIGPYDFGRNHLVELVRDFSSRKLKTAVKGGYDFVDVRDVASATINALTMGKSGNTYILSGRYETVKNMLNILANEINIKTLKHLTPMWCAKMALPFISMYARIKHIRPLFTAYSLYTLTAKCNFDNSKAKKDLLFNPRPLKESVMDTYNYLDNNKNMVKKLSLSLSK